VGILSSSTTENVKATTASTLSRLLRSSPQLLQPFMQRWGAQLLLRGMSDSSSKVQVACVNILNLALSQPDAGAALGPQLAALEGDVLAALAGLLDHTLPLLRCKALVTVILLCRCARLLPAGQHAWVACACGHAARVAPHTRCVAAMPARRLQAHHTCAPARRLSAAWLLKCCQQKLVLHMERLARDKDTHTQVRWPAGHMQALISTRAGSRQHMRSLPALRVTTPTTQDAIGLLRLELAAAVRAMCTDMDACFAALYDEQAQQQQPPGSGRHGRSASSTSARSSSSALLPALDYLHVVLHLVTSPAFRPAVVDEGLLCCLASYLLAATLDDAVQQLSQQEEQCMAGFRASLLQVLEAVSQVRTTRGGGSWAPGTRTRGQDCGDAQTHPPCTPRTRRRAVPMHRCTARCVCCRCTATRRWRAPHAARVHVALPGRLPRPAHARAVQRDQQQQQQQQQPVGHTLLLPAHHVGLPGHLPHQPGHVRRQRQRRRQRQQRRPRRQQWRRQRQPRSGSST
jgi:hypothetical protein